MCGIDLVLLLFLSFWMSFIWHAQKIQLKKSVCIFYFTDILILTGEHYKIKSFLTSGTLNLYIDYDFITQAQMCGAVFRNKIQISL